MTDAEILEKVKQGLSVDGTDNDDTLKIKTMAVKQYMLNAGITQSAIETELGIATLTIGVSDIWLLTPGEIKFSFAFDMCLMPQLKAISM
jgi:hypothetical protein